MSGPVIFAVETFDAAYGEASELTRLHWQEVAPYKELNALDPDLETYRNLEKLNRLCMITARHKGELVGYILMLLYPHPHYRQVLNAMDDLHFIRADFRNGFTFLRMLAFMEAEMKARGARIVALRTKQAKDHGALFERIGYQVQDVVYTKRIGD